MADPAISVHDLTKVYKTPDGGEIRAVDGVSFQVKKGEVFGLLGPNGAGKTTTLEILEGLRVPTSGSAELLGVRIGSKGASDRHKLAASIGVQLQDSAYFEELSLLETLQLLGSFYPKAEDPLELLETVGLEERASSRYGQLSGGQARRFSIAAALINDPKVLFLDEPTTGLDPQARRNLWELIERIKESREVTVVLTTHYMEEAEVLCDRVSIVDTGKIVALDTPGELISSLGGSYKVSVMVKGIDREAALDILQASAPEASVEDSPQASTGAPVHIDFTSPTAAKFPRSSTSSPLAAPK